MPAQRIPKHYRAWDVPSTGTADSDRDEAFQGIRCPLCEWRPSRANLWCCYAVGTPEPFFEGCETSWNTFLTRGRCPGCHHQWQWTSCLRCNGWSLHEAWYEEKPHET